MILTSLSHYDWPALRHAYGRAADTPGHLQALVSGDAAARDAALKHLWSAVIHQGTPWTATAPAAMVVMELLRDGNADAALRAPLLSFLSAVAEAFAESDIPLPELEAMADAELPEDDEELYEDERAANALFAQSVLGCARHRPLLQETFARELQSEDAEVRSIAKAGLDLLTEEEPAPAATDIEDLAGQLEALAREAEALADGLSPEQGTQAPEPGAWSVSECLDHLATGNRVYLRAMEEPARRARERGRLRRRPAKPGWAGRLFVAMLEPPPKWWSRLKAPRKIRPRAAPPLADTFAAFMASQRDMLAFLRENADLDLASIGFPNPFIPGIRFSLATGLHVTVAHEKRHLLQARRARQRVLSSHADPRLGR